MDGEREKVTSMMLQTKTSSTPDAIPSASLCTEISGPNVAGTWCKAVRELTDVKYVIRCMEAP
jgi:hypothetical protein